MTKDEFDSLMVKGVMELDTPVAAFEGSMAQSMGELNAALSRVEMEVAAFQVEIAQMNLMVARRQRFLADRGDVPSLGLPPAAPDSTHRLVREAVSVAHFMPATGGASARP
ncbi:hypothetical protein OKW43_002960 [Paraburkholderia sp. WC7.3g]|uniref:hypothetical protein n=1 Tax=Paraburkholderia sp. WC7.3g TaxID=2991070 RepID=UPI003D232286